MKRTLTADEVADAIFHRNEHFKKSHIVYRDAPSDVRERMVRSASKGALSDERQRLQETAWPIEKYAIKPFAALASGTLHLPDGFMSTRYDKVRVRRGDDLNAIVSKFYAAPMDPKTALGINYVSDDSFMARRHEYLGPSPHVAAFRHDRGRIDVMWWDRTLRKAWSPSGDWTKDVDVEYNEEVDWWVSTNWHRL